MKVTVNGEVKELTDSISLTEAVGKLCNNPDGVVAELNHVVIVKNKWKEKRLRDGDILELIAFIGGG